MTDAGGGDGLLFFSFSELLSNKKTGRRKEATDAVHSIRNCESCTRPISTNPAFIEAGECALACGTCFVARRLEMVAVTGLLWISWCVLGAPGFRVFFSFCFLRTHTACCTYKCVAALPHLPLY